VSPFVVAAAALVLCAALVVVLWRRRARRRVGQRLRRPAPKLAHPVVLAHGIMGFDELKIAGVRHEYFRGIPSHLSAHGALVHVPRVSPLGSVAQRAGELAAVVNAIDAKKVNLIAHSLGGLDARYAITKLGLAPKVASLVTIGTPHRGTPIADLGTALGDKLGVRLILDTLGIDVRVLDELTTVHMQRFNTEVLDARDVWYASISARAASGVHPLLKPSQLLLARQAGDNDGMVPAASQRWGELIAEIDADHWAQIGWSDGFDAPDLYVRVMQELKARGF
jgi:triacylglycerol lipase